jgi:GxxExxY protein
LEPQDFTRLTQENNEKWLHKPLTEQIIGAAMEVHRTLGPGFLEYVYQEALCYELRLKKISYELQKDLDIYYKDIVISKKYTPDLLIEDSVIVEIKATSALTNNDEAQLINYIKASKKRIGLLINFGSQSLEIKRRIS